MVQRARSSKTPGNHLGSREGAVSLLSQVQYTESQLIVAGLNIRFYNKDLTRRYSLAEELRFSMLENTNLVKKHFTRNSACDINNVELARVCVASGLDKSYNG